MTSTEGRHCTTRVSSVCRFVGARGAGRRLECDLDRLLVGRLRCVAGRDVFSSIGPSNDVPGAPNPVPPTYAMRFCPVRGHQEILALANEDGRIMFQQTSLSRREWRRGQEKPAWKGHPLHKNAIYDFAWPCDDAATVATVSGDQSGRVWRLAPDGAAMAPLATLKGHSRSVKAVQFRPGDPQVLATASRDNTVRIWDIRTNKDAAENIIRNAHSSSSSSSSSNNSKCGWKNNSSVTDLAFESADRLISCGDNDGALKVWDLRRTYSMYRGDPVPRDRFSHPGDSARTGFTSLRLSDRFAYAGCMDSRIYQFDLCSRSEQPTRTFVGCESGSFFVRISVSSDGAYVASGSRDSAVYVWNAESARGGEVHPIGRLTGHDVEVTCVDWCKMPGQFRMASCGDDMRHRLWDLHGDCGGDDPALFAEDGQGYYAGAAEMTPLHYRDVGRKYVERRGGFASAPEMFLETKGIVIGDGARTARKRKLDTGSSSPKTTPDIKSFLCRKAAKRERAKEEQEGEDDQDCSNSRKRQRAAATNSALLDLPCSPRKMNVSPGKKKRLLELRASPAKRSIETPVKRLRLELEGECRVLSPTANLPNLVRDGGSSSRTPTPAKRRGAAPSDWLTNLSRQRKKTHSDTAKENVVASPKSSSAKKRKKTKI